MCGLTGWMSFKRNLKNHQSIAEKMTATMTNRGPDAAGLWVDDNIFFGHRRLSVIDLEGGKQPMHATNNDGDMVTISYTGEVYNYIELREELVTAGHKFESQSDTEVVLRAFIEWGESFVEKLNGMYAFSIWDSSKQELLLVRDRMGVKPLYYYPHGDEVIFGSEPKAILAHPEINAVIDSDGLREIFSIVKTPGHAVLQGMYEVKPGTILKFSKKGVTENKYWKLEAVEHTDDLPATINKVRKLLIDIIERQMVSDVPIGTLLSGGLDSSAITAIASKVLKAEKKNDPLLAFTIDFVGHSERFTSNVQWEDPDTPFAIEVANDVGAEHIKVVLDHNDIIDPEIRDATLKAQDLPVSTGDMEYSLYLLCSALRERLTVALSGEGADELFGGYTWFHDSDAIKLNSFPWHHPFSKAGGIQALQDIGLWDSLDLDRYISMRYNDALKEMPTLDSDNKTEARMRQINYLNLTRWQNFLLDRNDRISMAVGLEVRVPFLDHRLIEYVFNAPWEMKNFDGREKSLLRAAMRGFLPDSVLDRKKNPYPSTQDDKYELALREQVEATLKPGSPILSLVSKNNIRKLLDTPIGTYSVGGPWSARSVLERLVEFNNWVSLYNVTLKLDEVPEFLKVV